MKPTPKSIYLVLSQFFVLLGAGCAWAATEAASSGQLARLLAHAGEEPLAVVAFQDLRRAPRVLATSNLGQIFNDPQYSDGRAAAWKLLQDEVGADLPALWEALMPQLGGPAALVVKAAAQNDHTGTPKFVLLLAVADQEAGEFVRKMLPWLTPTQDQAPFVLQTIPLKDLARGTAPEWAQRLAAAPGFLRLFARPHALQAGWQKKNATWSDLATFERVELTVTPEGQGFLDRLSLELHPEVKTSSALLWGALRENPNAWKGLCAALPGGQDVAVLVQANLPTLGMALPIGLHSLERELRGKKWTHLEGHTAEAQSLDRFKFFTDVLSGTVGVTGGASATGEARFVIAGATMGQEVAPLRTLLLENFSMLGGEFQPKPNAVTIGKYAPLAAVFKGRSFLPAPVIGTSEGWLWLCSNTSAYGDLTGALSSGKVMSSDQEPAPLFPTPPVAEGEPASSPPTAAVRVRINLNAVAPMLYASWLLDREGPHLGTWKVPDSLLPTGPGLFNRRLGTYWADLRREGLTLHVASCGPVPGGVLLPVAMMAHAARAIDDLRERRADTLREKILLLEPVPVSEPKP